MRRDGPCGARPARDKRDRGAGFVEWGSSWGGTPLVAMAPTENRDGTQGLVRASDRFRCPAAFLRPGCPPATGLSSRVLRLSRQLLMLHLVVVVLVLHLQIMLAADAATGGGRIMGGEGTKAGAIAGDAVRGGRTGMKKRARGE